MSNVSYWNNTGRYNIAAEHMRRSIPREGAVAFPRSKNRNLDRLRRAVNCYYDLYNNGLCNRQSEFYRLYGIPSSHYGSYGAGYTRQLYNLVEHKMDDFIIAAAIEQGLSFLIEAVEDSIPG